MLSRQQPCFRFQKPPHVPTDPQQIQDIIDEAQTKGHKFQQAEIKGLHSSCCFILDVCAYAVHEEVLCAASGKHYASMEWVVLMMAMCYCSKFSLSPSFRLFSVLTSSIQLVLCVFASTWTTKSKARLWAPT